MNNCSVCGKPTNSHITPDGRDVYCHKCYLEIPDFQWASWEDIEKQKKAKRAVERAMSLALRREQDRQISMDDLVNGMMLEPDHDDRIINVDKEGNVEITTPYKKKKEDI